MGEPFDAVDVIVTKRDGGRLSDAQIDWVVDAYVRSVVAEEQMAALAMAVVLVGMDAGETARWTAAMVASGRRLDFTGLSRPTVDKHSTGGVGDKITLPLGPVVASFGVAVPQLSGRGLGHTGGTLDKLESIPGWSPWLTPAQMEAQLQAVGAVVAAAGDDLAPADRRLYALRDITGTVASVPLIASSIMSKKIAEGTASLVLDVKVGTGAFLPDLASATELAHTMVRLGEDCQVRTVALLTDMSTPLGATVGNALEVREAVEVLAGGGPSDVVELVCVLAREMLTLAGRPDADPSAALADGTAMDVWRAMVRAQGGDPDAPLPQATHTDVLVATTSGTLISVDALAVGTAAWRLGAGRTRRDDQVQPGAGIELLACLGDQVRPGQPLARLHTDTPDRFTRAHQALADAFTIAEATPAPRRLVLGRIGGGSDVGMGDTS
ncbi:MAG: thymidine phosphorylase [Micrococcales bacterium]|nr:thymidine phosphorylase [Micrococcales bacterium]